MKKMFFIIFLIIATFTVTSVDALEHVKYFNYGEFQESNVYVEQTDVLEVIYEDGVYKYRTRDYYKLPLIIVVDSYDVDLIDFLETSIDKSDILITTDCDKYKNGTCSVSYKIVDNPTFSIVHSQLVTIDIEENNLYLSVPDKIIVTDYDFEFTKYIETNITDDLLVEGFVDLFTNGTYYASVKYKHKVATTEIIVDIKENIKDEFNNDDIDNDIGNSSDSSFIIEDNVSNNDNDLSLDTNLKNDEDIVSNSKGDIDVSIDNKDVLEDVDRIDSNEEFDKDVINASLAVGDKKEKSSSNNSVYYYVIAGITLLIILVSIFVKRKI